MKTYPKDLGFGYSKSYKDKKTGADVKYLKISLRAELLSTAKPNEKGVIELVVFPNTNKKAENHPDVTVKVSTQKAKGTNGQATSQAPAANGGFPF